MRVEVVMPQMGESVAEGTIIKWHKQPGEEIEQDEILLEISTDKVDSEIPSSHEGKLAEIVVEEGETVDVGTTIAYIETEKDADIESGDGTSNGSAEEDEAKAAESEEIAASDDGISVETKGRSGKDFYSPLVRSIASKEGVSQAELESIEGTGIGGRVRKQDLLAYLEERGETGGKRAPAKPVEPIKYTGSMENVNVVEMDSMRKTIARHMRTSLDTSAHVYSVSEVDMSKVVDFREANKTAFQKQEGFKLTYTPFIAYATVKALKDFPRVNASVDMEKGQILEKRFINLGMAVAIEDGLIVPVIKGADERSFLGLAREIRRLAENARMKELEPDDVQNGTFTITNPGVFGNLYGLPIINQPQLGILGVGAIKKKPVVINDAIAIRSMMYLTLSYDHRVLDGAIGGQFLQRIVQYLEEFDGEGLI
ncbi:MAG: 2-oxo acid dehydrogenase subunit E2 [Candidatus Marinimicrobia bacterium]|nr:2-oxo acid dehydrogenase subunit E2 [Candidatus Neomarinimicrobiota bacterium]MCF7828402.1 2-oxo acid dehydrogenase subunit E2 [Candidatus Neomarinimicrobiota bacterium]MCF7881004.1 2-oxo acid dehydrogenase subunit E2 [Candidatus Neomarinimicrobiota bacterium]